jgi:hypothetical protein
MASLHVDAVKNKHTRTKQVIDGACCCLVDGGEMLCWVYVMADS